MSSGRLLLKDKNEWVIPHVKDRLVLDLGCVDHSIEINWKHPFLHKTIVDNAKSVTGVDIECDQVDKLNAMGYHILCADVEKMDLNKQYECIVAGDLIEHLNNPGTFLEVVKKHLSPGGIFLMSTPNPFNILRFMTILFYGKDRANKQHTAWYSPVVIKHLCNRYGLKVNSVYYIDDAYQYYNKNLRWSLFLGLNYLLCKFRPQLAETLCFEISHA